MTITELIKNLVNDNPSIIIAGIFTIIGILIGSKLISNRELKNYRRVLLEQCASSVNELGKSIQKINRIMISFLTTQDISQIQEFDSHAEMDKISNKSHDCDLMITLHARSLMGKVEKYANNIQSWIDKFKDLPLTGDIDPELADQIKDLYKAITVSQDKLISAISDEIYHSSYYSRFTNYIKEHGPRTKTKKSN